MIFQWIKDYINDIKISWMMVRYKRSRDNSFSYDYIQDRDLRLQQRQEMWVGQNQIYQAMNNYNTQVGGHGGNGYSVYGSGGGGSNEEWSNGPDNGYKIRKRIDAGGKAIGVCTRWDLFYFMVKDKDEESYNHLIYLSTDGFSKHDWQVEIIGVDLV